MSRLFSDYYFFAGAKAWSQDTLRFRCKSHLSSRKFAEISAWGLLYNTLLKKIGYKKTQANLDIKSMTTRAKIRKRSSKV